MPLVYIDNTDKDEDIRQIYLENNLVPRPLISIQTCLVTHVKCYFCDLLFSRKKSVSSISFPKQFLTAYTCSGFKLGATTMFVFPNQ